MAQGELREVGCLTIQNSVIGGFLMQKKDYIPTVKSLIEQKAIAVSGYEEMIREFSAFVYFKGFHFDKSKINFDFNNETMLEIDDKYDCSELFSQCPRTCESTRVLYSLELYETVCLTVHRRSGLGDSRHLVFVTNAGNAEQKEAAFEKVYDLLDSSEYFYACQRCHKLVDSRLLDASTEPVCAADSCVKTFKQDFDISYIDRVTSSQHDEIRAAIFDDAIIIFNEVTFWPNPHECVSGYDIKASLPLSSTPSEVRELKAEIEKDHKYPANCFYCKKELFEGGGMELNSFVDGETNAVVCYGCATEHHGVVY